jgi:DNA-directed RNA polymerase I subunit RPA2
MVPDKDRSATERRIFPNEARERLTSYRAKLAVRIKWAVTGDDGEEATYEETKDCGLLPVMVKVSKQVWRHAVVIEIAQYFSSSVESM